jgi:phenylacetic acid degradation operon negative regulatory protein
MPSLRPQDLVFTLFGEYLLHRPESVPVQSLIRLLAPFDLSAGAVRTVLSRMVGKGWLLSSRRGHYGLSARGRRLLEAGEQKILHPAWDEPWDGQWFLLAYSIPEDRRPVRDRLRDRLAWLGFGSLGNGLWISPHDAAAEVEELVAEMKLTGRLVCFRGPAVGFVEMPDLVATCWDLEAVNERYEGFIREWADEFIRCRDALPVGEVGDEECFRLRFRLMHEYREFPLLDPYLPRTMLPSDWGGECAAHLFRVFHDMLVEPADRWVDSVLAESAAHSRPRRRTAAAQGSD